MQYPSGYIRARLAELAQPVSLVVIGLWVAAGVVVMSRLNVLGSKTVHE